MPGVSQPALPHEDPAATPSRSRTVTSTPCSWRCHAVARPTMPAPTTIAVLGARPVPGRGTGTAEDDALTAGSFDRRPPRGSRGGRVAGARRGGAARLPDWSIVRWETRDAEGTSVGCASRGVVFDEGGEQRDGAEGSSTAVRTGRAGRDGPPDPRRPHRRRAGHQRRD